MGTKRQRSYLRLHQNILLTIRVSDSADWAGSITGTTIPTAVTYDWIKVYRYIGK